MTPSLKFSIERFFIKAESWFFTFCDLLDHLEAVDQSNADMALSSFYPKRLCVYLNHPKHVRVPAPLRSAPAVRLIFRLSSSATRSPHLLPTQLPASRWPSQQ
jgi:hypothetical protein